MIAGRRSSYESFTWLNTEASQKNGHSKECDVSFQRRET